MPRKAGAPLAFAGIRVADFSHFLAGPVCSLILGDLGADVIKIEKVEGGDDFRRLLPAVSSTEGAPFVWGNRNKRSIALDLKDPDGRAHRVRDRQQIRCAGGEFLDRGDGEVRPGL